MGAYFSTLDEQIADLAVDGSGARLFDRGTILLAIYGASIGRIGILRNLRHATRLHWAFSLTIP